MFFVLKIPSEKIKDKMITDARQRITALNKTFDEATAALKSGFSEKFGSRLVTDTLTVEEETETEKLVREKYTTHQWNWKR
jgi:lipoate-protein ligase A